MPRMMKHRCRKLGISALLVMCTTATGTLFAAATTSQHDQTGLRLTGKVLDSAGIPLEGPQDVVFRFFSEETEVEPLLTVEHSTTAEWPLLPDSLRFTDGEFGVVLVAANALDGPAAGTYRSPEEVFESFPDPWISIEIDGNWESEKIQVTSDRGTIVPVSFGGSESAGLVVTLPASPADESTALESAEGDTDDFGADPSSHTDYNLRCVWRTTCASTRIQIKWPRTSTCFAGAVPDLPLAIVLRGNGFGYRDYDYLQNHLSANGILSVSMDLVAANESSAAHQSVADRAEQVLTGSCFDSFLDRFATAEPVDFQRTAIVGHSRGGESARFLAENLAANPRFTTRAVVALAPTRATTMPIYGIHSKSYMLLYGSSDTDVPPVEAFAAHDLAGWNEFSTPTSFDLDRSMKLLAGGTHSGFVDGGLLGASQRATTRGYVHAFLRHWLRNDSRFYGFVSRDLIPGPLSRVFSQFSTSRSRRVIDNFQHVALSPSTIGGQVFPVGTSFQVLADGNNLPDSPHAGRLFLVKPNLNGAYVAWTIPDGKRNATPYRYLSLRIGLLNDDGPAKVRLWLLNGSQFSSVDLDTLGGVPEPIKMCINGNPNFCNEIAEQGHMKTFRVPLSSFGSRNDVRAVYLQFLDGAPGKEFIIDNLELADPSLVIGF